MASGISHFNKIKHKQRVSFEEIANKNNDFVSYSDKINGAANNILLDRGQEWSNVCSKYLESFHYIQYPQTETNRVALNALNLFSSEIDILGNQNKKTVIDLHKQIIVSLLALVDPNFLDCKETIRLASLYKELGIENEILLQALALKIFQFPEHTIEELFDTIWAFSGDIFKYPWMFSMISKILISNIDNISVEKAFDMLDALRTINYFDATLFQLIAGKTLSKIDTFSTSEICKILCCFTQYATLNSSMGLNSNINGLPLINNQIMLKMDNFDAEEIFRIIQSLDTLGILSNDIALYQMLMLRVKQFQYFYNSSQLTYLTSILFKINFKDFSILETIAKVAQYRVHEFSSNDFVHLISCFGQFFFDNPTYKSAFNMQIFYDIVQDIKQDLFRFNHEELEILLWNFRVLNVQDINFLFLLTQTLKTTATLIK